MDLTNLSDLQLALKLAGIKPNLELGQHFLADRTSLEQILAAADLTAADTILEIGPGLGVLTEQLSQQAAEVVAVEVDSRLAKMLERRLSVAVVNQDILQFDFRRLPAGYKVVANLPYYLTSKILRLLLENLHPPQLTVLLVQKEVAERVTAQPGEMSVLALSVQYYTEPAVLGVVAKDKFWPQPEVDSAILRLQRRPRPAFPADPDRLFRLIKAGFGERRKQLKNSLAGGLGIEVAKAEQVIRQAGLNPTARAQELSLKDWQRLYQATQGLI